MNAIIVVNCYKLPVTYGLKLHLQKNYVDGSMRHKICISVRLVWPYHVLSKAFRGTAYDLTPV